MSSSPQRPSLWPLEKIAANLSKIKQQQQSSSSSSSSSTNCSYYVLLTTGAMNPVHKGHVAALRHCAEQLTSNSSSSSSSSSGAGAAAAVVVGAFISPSSDCYLQGKFHGTTNDFFLPAHIRHAACVKSTQDDDLISVGGYEVSFSDRWPDFPEVCRHLQQTLNAECERLWSEGGDDDDDTNSSSSTTAAGAASQQQRQPPPRLQVVYCCGSDHYLKCMLHHGVHMGRDFGYAPVAVTVRAGDEATIQRQKRELEQKEDRRQNNHHRAFLLPALEGPLAEISSTKVRQSLKLLTGAMHGAALEKVLATMMSAV